jgi:hypothetical protein
LFNKCVSDIGKAGAILITKLTGSKPLDLNITNITVNESKAKTLGASIFIANTIRLSTPSYISHSNFTKNKTEYMGNIVLYFLEGVLTINNNTFTENEGAGAGITAYFS